MLRGMHFEHAGMPKAFHTALFVRFLCISSIVHEFWWSIPVHMNGQFAGSKRETDGHEGECNQQTDPTSAKLSFFVLSK